MTMKNKAAARAEERQRAAAGAPRWMATACAAAAAATVLMAAAPNAHALALGRITVLSALGEPLRAEIEVPEINAAEAESLRVNTASPATFREAGVEYNGALAGLRINLQRRADGQPVLRVTGDRPVNEPFLDLVLEANWATGRLRRDYTLLFDPPANRSAQPAIAAVPQAGSTPRAPAAAPVVTAPPVAAGAPLPRAVAPAAAPSAAPSAPTASQVTVRSGDTAGRIAARVKPANVSLDQMLVALLRNNPDAFVGGNVNRIRAGAVLDVPDSNAVQSLPAPEAAQTVIAQSRDFNEYRRRLAGNAAAAPATAAQRSTSGQVQTQVEESRAATAAPDKLTLSKGAVQGSRNAPSGEERVARASQSRDNQARMAELSRNVNELNRLGAPAASAPAAAAPAAAARPPAVPVPAPAPAAPTPAPAPAPAPTPAAPPPAPVTAPAPAAAPATAPAPVAVPAPASAPAAAPNSAPAPASAPAATDAASAPDTAPVVAPAPAPAPAPVAATPPVAPAPEAEAPGLMATLTEQPLLPLMAGLLVALLAGFGLYRARNRRRTDHVDSSFLESRLQPDSFFGASGGQRIDTSESGTTGSSMAYSPSQLDAGGDVDPVAEADVYLAYGRDLQAEEILKEALRTHPDRTAIHSKLLEIYNRRRDAAAFAGVATTLHDLTGAEGADWERAAELGRTLDPANPLYRTDPSSETRPADLLAVPSALSSAPVPAPADDGAIDLELPLDSGPAADEPYYEPSFAASAPATLDVSAPLPDLPPPSRSAPLEFPSADFDATPPAERTATLDMGAPSAPGGLDTSLASAPMPAESGAYDSDFDFILEDSQRGSLDTQPDASISPAPVARAPAVPGTLDSGSGMLEFDLNDISLDLNDQPGKAPVPPSTGATPLAPSQAALDELPSGDDPLATKLALAQEFNAIGDADGARALVEEVLAEASGSTRTRAERLLAEIG